MAKVKNTFDLDPIYTELGIFGKYNLMHYAFLFVPLCLAAARGSLYIFQAQDIPYRCHISECAHLQNDSWIRNAIPMTDKGVPSKCTRYPMATASRVNGSQCLSGDFDTTRIEACTSIVYGEESSAVKDFDLGCQEWKRTLIGTIHNIGFLISLPLSGFVSDKYGRRVSLAVGSLTCSIFGILSVLSLNYEMYIAMEFIGSAFGTSTYTTCFVIAMELVSPRGRVVVNTVINVFFVSGYLLLSLLAWALQDWKKLLYSIFIPTLFVFSYIRLLDESIRWLVSKGKTEEAMVTIKKAAKMNKIDISEDLLAPLNVDQLETLSLTEKDETGKEEEEKSMFSMVFKSKILLKRVAVCSFQWITCAFIFYGFLINSVSLAGNKYVNYALVSLMIVPASGLSQLVLDKFGRKKPLITLYVLNAILSISMIFLPKDQTTWFLIFYLLGMLCIITAFSALYIYVAELFPTNLRQSLLATCSSFGRIGSTLAPQTPLFAQYYEHLPSIIFVVMTLIASALVLFLPETYNTPLPDTIEEAERLSSTKSLDEES